MPRLKTIPKEVISKLSSLKLFSMQVEGRDHFSQDLDMELNYSLEEGKKAHYSSKEEEAADLWEDNKANYLWQDNKALLEELAGSEHINEVSFPIEGALSFEKLLRSQKPQNAMRCLSLGNLDGMASLQLPRMKHLHMLTIERCQELKEMKVDLEKVGEWGFAADGIVNSNFQCLCYVIISQLPKLLHLAWLIYIPSLEFLGVTKRESMEELIGDEGGVSENLGIFSRLKGVILDDLPNLRSISEQALPFPSLTEIAVYNCPTLRKLPLDSNSATNS